MQCSAAPADRSKMPSKEPIGCDTVEVVMSSHFEKRAIGIAIQNSLAAPPTESSVSSARNVWKATSLGSGLLDGDSDAANDSQLEECVDQQLETSLEDDDKYKTAVNIISRRRNVCLLMPNFMYCPHLAVTDSGRHPSAPLNNNSIGDCTAAANVSNVTAPGERVFDCYGVLLAFYDKTDGGPNEAKDLQAVAHDIRGMQRYAMMHWRPICVFVGNIPLYPCRPDCNIDNTETEPHCSTMAQATNSDEDGAKKRKNTQCGASTEPHCSTMTEAASSNEDGAKKRKNNQCGAMRSSAVDAFVALMQIELAVDTVMCTSPEDAANYVARCCSAMKLNYSRGLSSIYKNRPNLPVALNDYEADALQNIWVGQLMQIPSVSEPIARAIAARFETPNKLMDRLASDADAVEMEIMNLQIVTRSAQRQIGPAITRRIALQFSRNSAAEDPVA